MSEQAYKFQIVSEGIYEEALNLYLKDSIDSNLKKLKEFFESPAHKDISFEIFFKDDDYKSFIGFEIEPLDRAKQYVQLNQLVSIITAEMVMLDATKHVADIFQTKVSLDNSAFMEVGFDVFWGSRGHVIVQDENQTMPYDGLLKNYPQFDAKYDDRPIMMEYAWHKNESEGIIYRYWLAKQLSPENGKIDRDRYNNLVQ